MECGTSDAGIAGIQAGVASRVGGRTVGPLWIAGATGRLSATIREDPRTPGEDPSIFATALGTLAIKTFGDMGQTARLRIIWDRFIAGQISPAMKRSRIIRSRASAFGQCGGGDPYPGHCGSLPGVGESC